MAFISRSAGFCSERHRSNGNGLGVVGIGWARVGCRTLGQGQPRQHKFFARPARVLGFGRMPGIVLSASLLRHDSSSRLAPCRRRIKQAVASRGPPDYCG